MTQTNTGARLRTTAAAKEKTVAERDMIRKLETALGRARGIAAGIVEGRRQGHRPCTRYRAVERQIADLKRVVEIYRKECVR